MKKRCIRFFGGLLSLQEKWLNRMSSRGYRLVHTGILSYEFDACDANRYLYCIEFISNKSSSEISKYINFLNDLGYRTIYKNMNLDYCIGKFKWRPWAGKGNRIPASWSTFNRELLIVEKENDGNPFEIYSTLADKKSYYKTLKTPYMFLSSFFFLLGFFDRTWMAFPMGAVFLIPLLFYQYMVFEISCEERIKEY